MKKVGILVVYFLSEDNDWVFFKHIRNISQTKSCFDFVLYAATNKISEIYKNVLKSYSFVKIVDLPCLDLTGGAEHGAYLNLLAKYALDDGCDYLATFDVDSWPIRSDWIDRVIGEMRSDSARAAAILRSENGDRILPHPSFCFVDATLFRDPLCRYWRPLDDENTEYQRFLWKYGQLGDTGAALGFFLEERAHRWVRLRRSNVVNYHYLMAGIYGEFVFHVGASSRKKIVFRGDDPSWITGVARLLSQAPLLWRVGPQLLKALKIVYEPTVAIRNRKTFDMIAERIRTDEECFYRELVPGITDG